MGKLQEKMKADLTLKGYSEHTKGAYLRYLRKFANHFMRSPAEMGEEEIRAFLLYLVEEQEADPYLQWWMRIGGKRSVHGPTRVDTRRRLPPFGDWTREQPHGGLTFPFIS